MDHQQWKQMEDAFCKQIETELEKISKMPALNDATLNNLHKLTDTKKNLLKIDKLEMEMNGGMMEGNSYRGNSYGYYGNSNGYMPQNNGWDNSYRNNMGYSRTDAYSHLEAAMRDARNDQEREEIRQLMSRYHN